MTIAAAPCSHSRAIVGLDAFYCPVCRTSISARTPGYALLLEGDAGQPQPEPPPRRSPPKPKPQPAGQLVLMF
jgi:hypothetical protein